MMRFLLVEAAQVTVRSVTELGSQYLHLMTIRSGASSVRTRDSPDIAMVCGRTPRN